MSALHIGAFVLSLDLDRSVTHGNPALRGVSSPVGSKLLAMIADRDIEATWALYDPTKSVWLEAIRATAPTQEVALLADGRWLAGKRAEFAAGLIALATKARSSELLASSLAWRTSASTTHLDLLVKQGITAVRSLTDDLDSPTVGGLKGWLQGRSAIASSMRALRWGLWDVAGQDDLLSSGFKEVRRAIDRAANEHGIVHLVVDVANLSNRELDVLEQVLTYVEERRSKDQLCNPTLAALAQQLTYPRQTVPAGSILRRSAA